MSAGPRVLLAGGGSGGSATPVLAVAQELRRLAPTAELVYVGTREGPEAHLATAQGIPFAAVASGRLRRYWDRRNLTDPAQVVLGVAQAYRIARQFRPDLAFAAGGFGSVPPIIAARLAGARVHIHQQDVVPGLANRLLAPLAARISVALPTSRQHFPAGRTLVTGNPVRAEVLAADPAVAITSLKLDPGVPIVVFTGGGTGAAGLNRLVSSAASRLTGVCQVIHLTGQGRGGATPSLGRRYRTIEFLVEEMPHLLAAADVVVSRAGMGTLAELAALGKPAILVPMPASHQWNNARAFEALNAVRVCNQDSLTPESLAEAVLGLLVDGEERARLSNAIAESMPRDAATRVARQLLELNDLFAAFAHTN